MIDEKKIDAHHVFPKGYLADLSERVTARLQDCILNRTLIDKDANIRIGKKAPGVYLDEIKAEIGTKRLNEILKSHLLPSRGDASICDSNFLAFLKKRQSRFAKMIEKVTK